MFFEVTVDCTRLQIIYSLNALWQQKEEDMCYCLYRNVIAYIYSVSVKVFSAPSAKCKMRDVVEWKAVYQKSTKLLNQ